MKKLIALVLAALMLCTVSLAFAGILEPTGKLAGATVNATVGAYDEETKTFTVTLYEYDRYDEAEIAKLAVGDTIVAGGQLHIWGAGVRENVTPVVTVAAACLAGEHRHGGV